MPKIVALQKIIEDPLTLSQAQHHVLHVYQVDLTANRTQATLAMYARVGAQRPVNHITVQLPGQPPEGVNVVQWIYELLPQGTSEENVLRGATPVLEA